MGFLSKLFGKKESEPVAPFEMKPTAVMMDEDRYWQIVQDSLEEAGGDLECQANVVEQALEKLELGEIVGFELRTDKLLYDTYNSDMWCSAYLMNGGCSDDSFEYFRLWVISRGRAVYDSAKTDPDSLVRAANDNMGQEYDFEPFCYIASTVFRNNTGRELYDYIDHDRFKFGEGNYPQIDFTWQEDDPDSMERICPNLFRQFPLS